MRRGKAEVRNEKEGMPWRKNEISEIVMERKKDVS